MNINNNYVHSIIEIIFYILLFFNFLPLITAISANIKSEVEGEGFHRTLKYYIDTGNFQNKSCHVAIFLQLPSALYVNIDELADLRRLHKSSSCSEGEVDVELFAEKANYQNVSMCSRLTSTKTTLQVPIHQRYQFATPFGKPISIAIPRPHLLIGCRDRIKEHRVSKIKICWPCIEYSRKWRDVSYRWEGDGDFIWNIPVGNTSRQFEITCVTLFVTLSGAAYVLWAIYKSYKLPKDKKSKEN